MSLVVIIRRTSNGIIGRRVYLQNNILYAAKRSTSSFNCRVLKNDKLYRGVEKHLYTHLYL